ncbi:hypothetical protein BUALT_Bualt16G0065200 [Buddleja alternifolia]|uniref:Reverse transcriptase n=1 Tax=Buddleja alternifolia TaxID=168488 RepID=A0AAV6WFW9_9LAMI|nr:hypothetical protein BUALT_Bualt16G0065200 [Buddleja alternifolia]
MFMKYSTKKVLQDLEKYRRVIFSRAIKLDKEYLTPRAKMAWLKDDLLGRSLRSSQDIIRDFHTYIKHCFTDSQASHMIHSVLGSKIKDVLFAFSDDKAPSPDGGPDGYTVAFFKKAWSIIGDDISAGISNFFSSGKSHKELSSTLITLIPKVEVP